MKKFSKRYIVFGLIAYLFFLVFSFPATRAWPIVEKKIGLPPGMLQVSGVSGNWWSGRVDGAVVKGVDLYNLQWTFRPFGLLRGMVKAKISFETPGGNFKGVVAAGRKSVELAKVKAKLPLDQVNGILAGYGVQVGGLLVVDLKKMVVEDKLLVFADGAVVWQDALVELPQKLILGDLKASLSTDKEGIRLFFSDGGGPLVAEGVSTLASDGQYSFTAKLASRDADQPELGDAIKLLGAPGGDGKVSFSFAGKLPEF